MSPYMSINPFAVLQQYPLHKDAYLVVTIIKNDHEIISRAMEMEEAYNYGVSLYRVSSMIYSFSYYDEVLVFQMENEDGNTLRLEAKLARH